MTGDRFTPNPDNKSMLKTYSLIVLLLPVCCLSILSGSDSKQNERNLSRIAIVAAFQGEMDAIREEIEGEEITEEVSINGVQFLLGTAYGKKVVRLK